MTLPSRKICVVTGGRADYGLLIELLRDIENNSALTLQLVVSGMHLSAQFGMTIDAIEADGFEIAARVDMLQPGDDALAVSSSVAAGLNGFAEAFDVLCPDIVVVLGDRFEIFAAATAAMIARIPVAHIHGGEVTEGAIDDAIRHAISKMAHLHFVSAAAYRDRVIQLGEDPTRVFLVGAPGLDNLRDMTFLSRAELEADLGMALNAPLLLMTYHPATLQDDYAEQGMQALTQALELFPEATVVFTGVNADPGHARISEIIATFAETHPTHVGSFASLGQRRYLSLMKLADVVVGNSSSGIIEAPALATPTVNIGNRQAGRLRAASIIDCTETVDSIGQGISQAMSDKFKDSMDGVTHPYGDGMASRRMVEILSSIDLTGILIKKFHDVDPTTC